MDIEAKLKWLRNFDILAKSKRQEIAQLRASVYRSSHLFGSEDVGETTENLNLKIIDQSQEITKQLETMYDERERLVKLIDQLSDPAAVNVIRLFYVNGQSWKAVARETSQSVRAAQNIRREALRELEGMSKN